MIPIAGQRAIGRLIEKFRRVQHRLGRDAADIEAGAAQRLAAFHAGGLQPQLRRADRRDIAAGAGADDDQVKIYSPWENSLQINQQAGGVFDRFLDRLQCSHRLAAVDQAVVIAERQIHHRADDDLAVADDRAVFDAVQAEHGATAAG